MKKKTLYRQVLLSLMAGALFAGQAMAPIIPASLQAMPVTMRSMVL